MLSSTVCRYEHFLTDWYERWTTKLGFPLEVSPENPQGYRKNWEYCAILEAIDNRGLLQPGKKGLGFAVGREPIPSVLASYGVEVLATDLMSERVEPGWVETGQHADTLDALYHPALVERAVFERFVSFSPADMNNLEGMSGGYDFLWSSCAFEHLGSLEQGLAFVETAMRLLKPGGYAVHTTEYNVSSDTETVSEGSACIYRKQDMDILDRRLRKIGCGIEKINFDAGTHPYDLLYDTPPYYSDGTVHIKLELDGHICTSMLIVARKG